LIDFVGSTTDTPYQNVSEDIFKTFSTALRVDEYYEKNIENVYTPSQLNTESAIDSAL